MVLPLKIYKRLAPSLHLLLLILLLFIFGPVSFAQEQNVLRAQDSSSATAPTTDATTSPSTDTASASTATTPAQVLPDNAIPADPAVELLSAKVKASARSPESMSGPASIMNQTPLTDFEKAVISNDIELVDDFIKNNELKKYIGDKKNVPLFFAVMANAPEAIALLVKNGQEVDGKLPNGVTPFMFAVSWHLLDAARQLVQLGADVQQKIGNVSAAEYAYQTRQDKLLAILEKKGIKFSPPPLETVENMEATYKAQLATESKSTTTTTTATKATDKPISKKNSK